jgi:release factor glutamine methyltransferase
LFLLTLCDAGIVSTHLSALLPGLAIQFVGIDINADAALTAKRNFNANLDQRPHCMDCVVSDLTEGAFGPHLDGKVDVLLFNPPYVPTDDEEVGHSDIRASWAGGTDGRLVIDRFRDFAYPSCGFFSYYIDRFLPCVSRLLSPEGVFYLLLVHENHPLDIAKQMAERYYLVPKFVGKKVAKNERLYVLRFQKRKKESDK